nr:MAG TPA: hypothetical protein [Bacteriophage sp.]
MLLNFCNSKNFLKGWNLLNIPLFLVYMLKI